jgi:hypothetical protein
MPLTFDDDLKETAGRILEFRESPSSGKHAEQNRHCQGQVEADHPFQECQRTINLCETL